MESVFKDSILIRVVDFSFHVSSAVTVCKVEVGCSHGKSQLVTVLVYMEVHTTVFMMCKRNLLFIITFCKLICATLHLADF